MSRATGSSHTATAAAVALLLSSASGAVAQTRDQPTLVARLYDMPSSDAAARAAAMSVAAAILGDAGLAVQWRDCGRGGADYPCRPVDGARELIVRVMPTGGVPEPLRAPVSARAAVDAPTLHLGVAAVEAGVTGMLATVYRDNVLRVTQRAGLDYGELLGRAIAHEVGHLLLRGAGHSLSGLMRAVWTDAELIANRREDWTFAPPERDGLRAGIPASGTAR